MLGEKGELFIQIYGINEIVRVRFQTPFLTLIFFNSICQLIL